MYSATGPSKFMKQLLIASLSLFLLNGAFAEDKKEEPVNYNSGAELLMQCTAVQALREGKSSGNAAINLRAGLCLGLVKGVKDMLIVMNLQQPPVVPICFPESGISTDQAVQIVFNYLKANPEELNKSNTLLALLALKEAFPCERG